MKLTPTLDRDDRKALAQVGAYLLLFALFLVALLLLAVVAGLAVHAFHWAGG